MNIKIRKVLHACICLLMPITLFAQQPLGNEEPAVKVIGKVTKDAIMLRWSANTPTAWKYANKFGYIIERKTIAIGKEILKQPVIKKLTVKPLMPEPMQAWESLVDANDNAAIMAQALYGEDFDVKMEEGGNSFMHIMNMAKAQEQRFSFALYAADQDFEVAKIAALGYVDTDVKPTERYLYKIYTAIPSEKLIVKSGGVYLGLTDYQPLPQPQEFVGVFNDKSVLLSWNYKMLETTYNSYVIERSDDLGATFKPVNGLPMVNMNEKERENATRMIYIDSISNNKEFQYRLKGISSFGETGPFSNTVKGVGRKSLAFSPAITEASLNKENTKAVINWEFPEEGVPELAYFQLASSDQVKGKYQILVSNISKDTRKLEYGSLQSINYFKIIAIGLDGSKRISFPKMVQLDDTTPPAVPLLVTGVIDSTGVVQLKWQLNTEPDFLGYRVFRANLEKEEFTQITFEPIPKSTIIDTINIKTLNKKIYYKIQAFDKRYNPSGFSEVLMLKRPDIVPPTKPIFQSFNADKGAVTLKWITSSSEDAIKTLVYRKEKGGKDSWVLLADPSLPESQFIDRTAKPSIKYLYTLVTMDESGLESQPVKPLVVSLPDNMQKPTIDKFSFLVNREATNIVLNWKYKAAGVLEYNLYRAFQDEKPSLYRVFKNGEEKFTDKNLKVNSKYTYLLQAVFESRAMSPIKKIEVKY